MSEEKSIEDRVIEVVRFEFGTSADGIGRGTKFVDDMMADDLDMVEFVIGLEEEFGFAIQEKDAEKFATVGDVVDFIKRKNELFNGKEKAQETQA